MLAAAVAAAAAEEAVHAAPDGPLDRARQGVGSAAAAAAVVRLHQCPCQGGWRGWQKSCWRRRPRLHFGKEGQSTSIKTCHCFSSSTRAHQMAMHPQPCRGRTRHLCSPIWSSRRRTSLTTMLRRIATQLGYGANKRLLPHAPRTKQPILASVATPSGPRIRTPSWRTQRLQQARRRSVQCQKATGALILSQEVLLRDLF
mmetsp:Transcript_22597/g.63552  ORF Transcript_22597/g.63552 Transcript_22597/m.63552 type:complete len:200 (-) Transcript_22597:346-945(-)